MIKTFKVEVEGEGSSFYIEPRYKEKIVKMLCNFDVLSHVNRSFKSPKPEKKIEILTKEQGGCIVCGKPRRKNSKSKQYCDSCRKKLKEKTN